MRLIWLGLVLAAGAAVILSLGVLIQFCLGEELSRSSQFAKVYYTLWANVAIFAFLLAPERVLRWLQSVAKKLSDWKNHDN